MWCVSLSVTQGHITADTPERSPLRVSTHPRRSLTRQREEPSCLVCRDSALYRVWKFSRELRKWNSHTLEYTMDWLCKLQAHVSLLQPALCLWSYLSSLFFPPSWVGVKTQTVQPLQNINTLLMPSLCLWASRELLERGEYGRAMKQKADPDTDNVGWSNDLRNQDAHVCMHIKTTIHIPQKPIIMLILFVCILHNAPKGF